MARTAVVDVLEQAGFTVYPGPLYDTAPIGPCCVVGVPDLYDQAGRGDCAVWSARTQVHLIPPTQVAPAELDRLIGDAAIALAHVGQVEGRLEAAPYGAAPAAVYVFTVTEE